MANNRQKAAFLVVCWNNREIIDECLQALQKQTYKHCSIYVVDNNSSDGSAEYIRKNYPQVHLISSRVNNGFAKGNNLLVKQALKDPSVGYLALINSDAVIDKNWTSEIISYIADKENVASAQGLTLDYYNHNSIDTTHILVRSNLQSVQAGYMEPVKASMKYPARVFGVNAAAAVYTRDFTHAQHKQELFDEKFFMYLEDVDVAFRALITGWDNYFIPSAKAYHMGSASTKKRSGTFNIEMTVRNQAALLFKNMPLLTFLHFFVLGLKFERHFYKYISETYGKDAVRKVKKARWKGILRLPLYIADRYRNMHTCTLSRQDLERIVEQEGVRY